MLETGGHRVVLRGVVEYVLPFYDEAPGKSDPSLASFTDADFRERDQIFKAMVQDGINSIRIPLGLTDYNNETYHIGGKTGYLKRLRETVKSADHYGLRVILSWWDSLGWGPSIGEFYRRSFPMMQSVVEAIGNNPSVLYEPDNEPNGIDWGVWTRVMAATVKEWRSVFGYRGPLILDTINYSWSFSPTRAKYLQNLDSSLLDSPSQLVFANHRYPDGDTCFCGLSKQDWMSGVGRWVGRYPILGTEYGVYVDGFRPNNGWIEQFSSFIFRSEIPKGLNGGVFFLWSWVDPNSLTLTNHLTPTPYGRIIFGGVFRDG